MGRDVGRWVFMVWVFRKVVWALSGSGCEVCLEVGWEGGQCCGGIGDDCG